ncbi:HipA domain-containing protein [Duganella radicis]|uniref:HipA-like C-terminal domain-containing protein n=1 Tax=Duganella radicis TaxID=551988 RepID=A0A6L6PJA9_9BURK|nr:hypothetical protein [Duganella radicis]
MGSSPSTHILKPDIVRTDINVFASAVNETIMMLAAHRCGLPVARASYQPETQACLVQRYDRVRQADGRLLRIWQADFCQLLGKKSDVKYEQDGGPGPGARHRPSLSAQDRNGHGGAGSGRRACGRGGSAAVAGP